MSEERLVTIKKAFRAHVAAASRLRAPNFCVTTSQETYLKSKAAFFFAFGRAAKPFKIPDNMGVSHRCDELGGLEYTRLSKGLAKTASGGITGGYSIRLPDAFEAEASGRNISITIAARAAAATSSIFAVTYSTNDVGNSGWRRFTSTAEWTEFTMEYAVPHMLKGNGDFVAILPDVDGRPGTELAYLSLIVS